MIFVFLFVVKKITIFTDFYCIHECTEQLRMKHNEVLLYHVSGGIPH